MRRLVATIGCLLVAGCATTVGYLGGGVVNDTVPDFSFVPTGPCANGTLRGRAWFESGHKRFVGMAPGQGCRGPLTMSFRL